MKVGENFITRRPDSVYESLIARGRDKMTGYLDCVSTLLLTVLAVFIQPKQFFHCDGGPQSLVLATPFPFFLPARIITQSFILSLTAISRPSFESSARILNKIPFTSRVVPQPLFRCSILFIATLSPLKARIYYHVQGLQGSASD